MSKEKPWRFTESRAIRPFRVSEHGLRETSFRIRSDLEFTKDEPWQEIVEPDQIKHENFAPSFKLAVDVAALCSDAGISAENLRLGLILRDSALLRSTELARWPLDDVPEVYSVPQSALLQLSGQRGVEFVLQVSPAHKLSRQFRTAWHPGHVVCSRSFLVDTPSEGAGFPVQPVEAAYFQQLGLPAETVWIIQWYESADFDKPAESVLCVLINKDEAEKILRLSSNDSVGAVLWHEIAVEVFLEICLVVLSSDPQPAQQKDSLLAKVTARMTRETNLTFDELVAQSKSGVDSFRFLRAHLQKAMDLGNRIKHVSLGWRAS